MRGLGLLYRSDEDQRNPRMVKPNTRKTWLRIRTNEKAVNNSDQLKIINKRMN